jgi:polysaccharide biosynthesis transport protein
VALTVLALALSLLMSKVYEGEARVLVQPRASETVFELGSAPGLDPSLAIDTEIEIIESSTIERAVQRRLGGDPEVTAERVGETLMIEVRARHPEPAEAARLTNAFATEYIRFRRDQAVEDLLSAGAVIQEKVTETQAEIAALEAEISAASPPQQAPLEAQLEALIGQRALFEQRLDEVQVQAALKTGGAQLVAEADPPGDPAEPRPLRNSVLALILGLMLGGMLAALLEYLDESVQTRADLEQAAGDLPVLAVIPRVPGWRERGVRLRELAHSASAAPVAEAYRTLRTTLELLRTEGNLQLIQITSPSSGDGKTTTISGLAVMLASLGRRVVAVDGDLRRARLHQVLEVSNTAGLSSILTGDGRFPGPRAVLGTNSLSVVPAGPVPPNPSELLADVRTVQYLRDLARDYEIVLIDSPPVLPVTDAAVLAGSVDATVLVATAGKTTVRQVRAALDRLRQAGAPLIGLVLNGADQDAEEGYSYGYAEEDGSWRAKAGLAQAPPAETIPVGGRPAETGHDPRVPAAGPSAPSAGDTPHEPRGD